jgi:malate dehydrogenase (oxaloacetate-decarboxylating)
LRWYPPLTDIARRIRLRHRCQCTTEEHLFLTNFKQNKELLQDDLYLGQRKQRVRGDEYDQFINKFVSACKKRYPKAYIHFEDFGLNNARRILDRYTPQIACFNDDVQVCVDQNNSINASRLTTQRQGTGCVTLAAIMAAFKVSGTKWDEARFVMFGSGSAGTGIADQIKGAISQNTGKSTEEAGKQIW